jgi:hypothetical protein
MEGTRHERVAIVLASYVIGFTTAFILYANITNNNLIPDFSNVGASDTSTASVINAIPEVAEPENKLPIEVVEPFSVSYAEGRLEVINGEATNLLSFNPEVSGIDVDTASLTQSFHFGEIVYKVSPDNSFVFFCEQQDITASTCLGYVYDTVTGIIYPVVKNGAPVLVSDASLATVEFGKKGLVIGMNYSANISAPWVLIDSEGALDLQ